MGAKSKRKGNEGEREFLQLLKDRGIDAQRNDQMFKGGTDNPDIGAEIGGRAFHFEVKRTERFRLYDAVEQAQSDANGHRMPVVAHRMNRKPWVVVLTLERLECLDHTLFASHAVVGQIYQGNGGSVEYPSGHPGIVV